MLNLRFFRPHASIIALPDIQLPSFALITGLNGSGKTHLLEAIANGSVVAEEPRGNSIEIERISYLNWETIVPKDPEFYSTEDLQNEKDEIRRRLNSAFDAHARTFRGYRQAIPFEGLLAGVNRFSDIENILANSSLASHLRSQIDDTVTGVESSFLMTLPVKLRSLTRTIAQTAGKRVLYLSDSDFELLALPGDFETDIFSASFGRQFIGYRDAALRRMLLENEAARRQVPPNAFDQVLQSDNEPPWTVVNRALQSAGLKFEISQPDLYSYKNYRPHLLRVSDKLPINFSALSSGEKVLLSLVSCICCSKSSKSDDLPRLFLLDEIDATLHPSLSKAVLNTINETLVGHFGVMVIATTHSPSTIALAPEQNIFSIEAGSRGPVKVSKAEALNVLTIGVPTLAISYDGRRQVFVESPKDASIYSRLYVLCKSLLLSDRSLEFIATGTQSREEGSQNNGSDVVKRIVNSLSESGNISVFGLIDWDGHNNPNNRVTVLAHGVKDAIENVMLDPLLLSLALVKWFPNHSAQNVGETITYSTLLESAPAVYTRVSKFVVEKVLGSPATANIKTTYVSGLEIEVDTKYFTMDDHCLERAVLTAYPALKGRVRLQTSGLIGEIIDHVVVDSIKCLPRDITSVFKQLLEAVPNA